MKHPINHDCNQAVELACDMPIMSFNIVIKVTVTAKYMPSLFNVSCCTPLLIVTHPGLHRGCWCGKTFNSCPFQRPSRCQPMVESQSAPVIRLQGWQHLCPQYAHGYSLSTLLQSMLYVNHNTTPCNVRLSWLQFCMVMLESTDTTAGPDVT